jgi:nitrogen regulatory protein PII
MTHTAIKLTIIIERLIKPQVEALLQEAGLSGWSIFPGGGRGTHGVHRAQAAQLVREFAIIKIEVVLRDRARAEAIAETLTRDVLAEQPGVVWLEPVEVWRISKF